MPIRTRYIGILAAALLASSALSGCGTINEKLAAGMSDAIPAWAGGLPADAPPRPGTLKYQDPREALFQSDGDSQPEHA